MFCILDISIHILHWRASVVCQAGPSLALGTRVYHATAESFAAIPLGLADGWKGAWIWIASEGAWSQNCGGALEACLRGSVALLALRSACYTRLDRASSLTFAAISFSVAELWQCTRIWIARVSAGGELSQTAGQGGLGWRVARSALSGATVAWRNHFALFAALGCSVLNATWSIARIFCARKGSLSGAAAFLLVTVGARTCWDFWVWRKNASLM